MFPAALGLVVLIRLLTSQKGQRAARPRQVSRGTSTFSEDQPLLRLTHSLILMPVPLFLVAGTLADLDDGTWMAPDILAKLCVVAPVLVLLFPSWFGFVFAAWGLPRLAYWTSWLSTITWRRDKPGGPALAAAAALVHQQKPSGVALSWVEGHLTTRRRPLQASGVAALGLVAAARGDLRQARRLLNSVFLFDRRIAIRPVTLIAAEWLAADAAAVGDWAKVEGLLLEVRGKRVRLSRSLLLFRALAARRAKRPSRLWFWWALAPRRRKTYRFVRELSNTQPAAPRSSPAPRGGGLEGALERYVRGTGVVFEPSRLEGEAAALDAALADPSLRTRLFERATLLGGGDPEFAITAFRQLIEADLALRLPVDAAWSFTDPLTPLLEAAISARREACLSELERSAQLLREARPTSEVPLMPDVWRRFVELMLAYDQIAQVGSSDRRLAFDTIATALGNYAVRLYNEWNERPIANAIFQVLAREAAQVDDAESYKLHLKNRECLL